MKKIIGFACLCVSMLQCGAVKEASGEEPGGNVLPRETVAAFPGAEGGGMYATGGRGGKVLYVTRLDDDDQPGSLRWALRQKYPRIVLFKVSGEIRLKSKITVSHGDLTIAGQSAPGDGICISDYTILFKEANNVIVRYLRFRLGDRSDTQDDAVSGQWNTNMIVDHCSISWSTDECASFYGNRAFTLQWCIISESLRNSVHDKGSHGYGGIWGGLDASFHHNLLASNDSRNPRLDHPYIYNDEHPVSTCRGVVDIRNNVICNWGSNNCYGGEGGFFNLVGNYYKKGPASKDRRYFIDAYGMYEHPDGVWNDTGYPKLYLQGNYYEGDPGGINSDNVKGISYNSRGGTKSEPLADELPVLGVRNHTTTHTAARAFDRVLAYAGTSLVRDAVDTRVVGDTRSGTATITDGGKGSTGGIIDTQAAVGSWPLYKSLPAPEDSDDDGMPDAWEQARGLDKNDPSDGAKRTLDPAGGYTNLEIYLNGLVETITANQNK